MPPGPGALAVLDRAKPAQLELTADDLKLLATAGGDDSLADRAAGDSRLLTAWARAAIAQAGQEAGFGHICSLPEELRQQLAQLLLHAATWHHYAVAAAAEARGGGGGGSLDGWPHAQACSEPLFAALSPQHQAWLISDVLVGLWAPEHGGRWGWRLLRLTILLSWG